jgi:hypothetical protein
MERASKNKSVLEVLVKIKLKLPTQYHRFIFSYVKIMQSLVTLSAKASLPCILPTDCLEKIVANNKVYGVLLKPRPDDNFLSSNKFVYDGFFSSREKAQERIWHLFPMCCADFYDEWLTSPTNETKKHLLKTTRAPVITEHILDPAYPCHTINVYFSEAGYVTNVSIDYPDEPVDVYYFAEYTVDFGKLTRYSQGSEEPDCIGMYGNQTQLEHSLYCQEVVTETLTISEQFPDVSEDTWQRVATTYGIDLAKLRERQAQKDDVDEEDEEIPFDEEVEQIVKQLVSRPARSKTHEVDARERGTK